MNDYVQFGNYNQPSGGCSSPIMRPIAVTAIPQRIVVPAYGGFGYSSSVQPGCGCDYDDIRCGCASPYVSLGALKSDCCYCRN